MRSTRRLSFGAVHVERGSVKHQAFHLPHFHEPSTPRLRPLLRTGRGTGRLATSARQATHHNYKFANSLKAGAAHADELRERQGEGRP